MNHELPTPNYDAAWDFLQRVHPGRLIVVTGISLDKKQLPTETFGPDDKAKFLTWVASCAAIPANLYFSVGEPIAAVTKKMERTDIKAVHYLHVDIDPRKDEDLAKEQARILALLRAPGGGLPPPTGIIYSGGGYQGFWKLSAPLVVDGNLEVAEDLKLFNVQIENMLGGDNCHDVSRIMRVPGTINVPDKKKLEKGRVAALAEVIEWHDDRIYDISQFVKAAVVQSPSGAGIGAAPRIKAPGNVRTFGHVDEVQGTHPVSDDVRVYIVNGEDPNSPGHFPSRSEMLFWVVCELVRAGVDDETIYAVLMNRDWKISESILEKGRGAQRYALRQIERAREDAIDPMLREFNDRHAVIENFGGKCVVVEEILDEVLNRACLSKQGFDHFRNRYMNRMVSIGSKTNKRTGETIEQEMPAGEWWLRHTQRRQYNKIIFAPGREVSGVYNLWRGFGCEAKEGKCGLFLDHIRNVVCGGNGDYYNYFIGWMANAVQNPGKQAESAIILRGKQGCGKSIVPNLFGQLFGRHYLMVNRADHLVGQFNAHLRDCVLLFADEAFFAGNKQNTNTLKTIVTSPTLLIEQKGVDAEQSANCIHLMMASNEKWVVDADFDDRRNFVLNVLPDKISQRAYFDAMVKQFEEAGGREALLHFLLDYDLSKWNGRAVPKTDALREQQGESMAWDVEAVVFMAEHGLHADAVLPQCSDKFRPESGDSRIGQWAYLRDVLQLKGEGRKFGSLKFANAMKEWGFQRADPDENGAIWQAPPLPELRRKIDEVTGKQRDWPSGPDADWDWATTRNTDVLGYKQTEREIAKQQVKEAKAALRDSVGADVFDRILRAGIALGKSGGDESPF